LKDVKHPITTGEKQREAVPQRGLSENERKPEGQQRNRKNWFKIGPKNATRNLPIAGEQLAGHEPQDNICRAFRAFQVLSFRDS
jgi:hypothetical protein